MGEETGIGRRVIVLGGGNVAFDCARSARRLGAEEIHLACLEARDKMTADDEEIEQAQEEGILIHPARTFERITGEDHVTGVDFMKVESFMFDENRRAIIKKSRGPGTTLRRTRSSLPQGRGQASRRMRGWPWAVPTASPRSREARQPRWKASSQPGTRCTGQSPSSWPSRQEGRRPGRSTVTWAATGTSARSWRRSSTQTPGSVRPGALPGRSVSARR